eukprot:gene10977-22938_t
MNQSFKEVVSFFKPAFKPSHKYEIMRLYRKSLRLLGSWAENREIFNTEGLKIRAEFNASMSLPVDSPKVKRLVREAYERLQEQAHPDPYIVPYMPGGSLFMRNPAVPLEACFPDGIPEEYSKRRVNIDFSNIPDDQPYADKVFVDSITKSYWIDK